MEFWETQEVKWGIRCGVGLWYGVWKSSYFLQSLESEQNSDQTMDFIVTPNATCKNISMNTSSEEKDILRHIARYPNSENVREKFFLSEQI